MSGWDKRAWLQENSLTRMGGKLSGQTQRSMHALGLLLVGRLAKTILTAVFGAEQAADGLLVLNVKEPRGSHESVVRH